MAEKNVKNATFLPFPLQKAIRYDIIGGMKEISKFLIVGLGNPDEKYQDTFHNVGFMAVDRLAEKLNVKFAKGECRAITAHANFNGAKVIIAKPITYMNLSGDAVRELVNKYKIQRENFLVVFDDVDLPLGSVRIRDHGTAGTHNGMRDVVAKTNTEQIMRIRVGIGQTHFGELCDYVLSKMTDKDKKTLSTAFDNASDAVLDFIRGDSIDQLMQKYNKVLSV